MSTAAPPRLAFVYEQRHPDTVGGAERYYAALTRRLAAGQPVTYLTRRFPGRARRETEAGVEVVGLTRARPEPRSFVLRNLVKAGFALAVGLHLLVRGGRYDVVHVCCFPHAVALAARAGLAPHRRTRLVVDWHEVHSEADWRDRLGGRAGLGRRLQRLAVRTGDVAVAFSRLHARRLGDEGRRGAVEMLPEFLPEEPAAEPAPERERLVVFAARLVPQKRAHLVPEVLRVLREGDPSWRAVIFGDGPDLGRVERAAANAGVTDALELPGFVGWEELSRRLARAACLVLPTTREGFGLVVLEAAAHGVPAVLVDEPDNAATELIEDGRNGRVCPEPDPAGLAAAVEALVADPAIHSRTLGWYAEASARHSADAATGELRALHARLLGNL